MYLGWPEGPIQVRSVILSIALRGFVKSTCTILEPNMGAYVSQEGSSVSLLELSQKLSDFQAVNTFPL